jgi:hypothetical protein
VAKTHGVTRKWLQRPRPGAARSVAAVFASLSFGLPTMARMSDGSVLLAFWAEVDGLTEIRLLRLAVAPQPA